MTKKSNDLKSKINPKKKFAFTNQKINKTSEIKEVTSTITDLNSNQIQQDDLYLNNKTNEKIIFSEEIVKDKNSLFIENLSNCEVYILYNFKALYLKNITKCKIFIGSISGGSHITDCKDSEFYLITHQLRIHKTYQTLFSIIVGSNPIIESCSDLIFSCLKICYKNYSNNLNVNIFF